MLNISSKLANLLDNKELIDVKLKIGGEIYEAHKLILGANSPVFKAMFTDSRWTKCDSQLIDLNEDSCCFPIFSLFLRYMYTNTVNFTLSNVLPIMILADKYQVMDLLNICLQYMKYNISNAIDNGEIFFWHQYCIASSQPNVMFLENFICYNFSLIIKSDYFVQLPYHILKYFLMKSELVITNESCLQKAFMQWYDVNKSKNLDCDLSNVCLRTPYFSLDLLIDIFNNKVNHGQKYSLNVATKFHAFNSKERLMIKWNGDKILITPRIYTSELWSTTFVIPNFSKFPSYGVRTEIFSTLSSSSRADNKIFWEWTLDFYPKGIHYDKSLFISTNKTFELPGLSLNSVQARLTATGNLHSHPRKVDVYFLFYSSNSSNLNLPPSDSSPAISPDSENNVDSMPDFYNAIDTSLNEGTEFIKTIVKRSNCYFNDHRKILHFAQQFAKRNKPQISFHHRDFRNERDGTHFSSGANFYEDFDMYRNSSYYHDHRYHLPSLKAHPYQHDSREYDDYQEVNDQQTAMKFEDLVPFTKLNPSKAQFCNKHFGKYWQTFLHRKDHLLLGDIDALKVTVVIIPCM